MWFYYSLSLEYKFSKKDRGVLWPPHILLAFGECRVHGIHRLLNGCVHHLLMGLIHFISVLFVIGAQKLVKVDRVINAKDTADIVSDCHGEGFDNCVGMIKHSITSK